MRLRRTCRATLMYIDILNLPLSAHPLLSPPPKWSSNISRGPKSCCTNCICKMARQIGFAVEAIHMLHPDFEFRRIAPLYWFEKIIYRVLDTRVL